MKIISLNKYSYATILLMAIAVFFVALSFIIDLGEFINSIFVISGAICAMFGIFILTLSGGEPINPRLVGLMSAQGCITLCRITHHLGMHGNAYFLPPGVTGETKIMQFNPILTYDGKEGAEKGLFREKGPAGLVTSPSCDLLIEDLKKRNAMIIPNNKENISLLLRETIEDVLKFAPKFSYTWSGSTVTITFHNYMYIDGCIAIAQKSPQCCTMSPCPASSLCGALIAEGLDKVVKFDRCSVSPSSKDIIAVFSMVPSLDGNP